MPAKAVACRSVKVGFCQDVTRCAKSRASRISAFSRRRNSRICCQWPPFHAFLDALALPAAVRGPVDLVHGCHLRISSACLALRSGVHGSAIASLNSPFVHDGVFPRVRVRAKRAGARSVRKTGGRFLDLQRREGVGAVRSGMPPDFWPSPRLGWCSPTDALRGRVSLAR